MLRVAIADLACPSIRAFAKGIHFLPNVVLQPRGAHFLFLPPMTLLPIMCTPLPFSLAQLRGAQLRLARLLHRAAGGLRRCHPAAGPHDQCQELHPGKRGVLYVALDGVFSWQTTCALGLQAAC